jgi:hypothetical protein
MDFDHAAQIKHLTRAGLNWSRLLRTAEPHGMMPLLYWQLKTICPESVPPSALQELRDHFHANSRRNLFLVTELLEVLTLFHSNGIPAIPYKGPVLAASVYGNVALRQFGDLDIVVPRSDALRASDLLRLRGYQPRMRLSAWQEAAFLATEREFHQVRADRNVAVEVQWEIVPRRMVASIDLLCGSDCPRLSTRGSSPDAVRARNDSLLGTAGLDLLRVRAGASSSRH